MRRIFLLALALAAPLAPRAAAQDTTSNLEAHYTLNSNGNDSTANNRHLSALGTVTHATGQVGNALMRGAYQLADASFLNSDSTYTVALWTYAASASRVEPNVLIVGPSIQDAVIFKAPRSVETVNTLTGPHVTRAKAATPGTPAWSFHAIVCSSGTATHYTNRTGALVATSLSGTWTMPTSGTKIVVGPAQYAAGVDQLRIYSRALALEDIEALEAE